MIAKDDHKPIIAEYRACAVNCMTVYVCMCVYIYMCILI